MMGVGVHLRSVGSLFVLGFSWFSELKGTYRILTTSSGATIHRAMAPDTAPDNACSSTRRLPTPPPPRRSSSLTRSPGAVPKRSRTLPGASHA